MGSVDDAKSAVAAAQSALDTANTVLADIEGESNVSSVTVTGVTIHYSDGSSTEFALEDAGTGLPPTGGNAGDQNGTVGETPSADTSSTATDTNTDTAAAESSGESTATAPDAPAGTIPE